MRRCSHIECLLPVVLTLLSVPARGQDFESDPDLLVISEVHWGFDGQVPLQQFCPVTFEVKNVGTTSWQGELSLSRSMQLGARRFGAILVQSISLQPEETRWVQMTPYVMNDDEDWTLKWGPGENHQFDLPPVSKGDRATVLVYDTDAATVERNVFKRFPEERMPASVTSLDALRGLIFDTPPFWQGGRVRAFRDWLTLGGRVYLLHNEQGEYAKFPAAMSFLNYESEEFQIGQGRVKRIPRKASDFTLNEARTMIFNDDASGSDEQKKEVVNPNRGAPPGAMSNFGSVWIKNEDIFRNLIELAKFERKWWLIYPAVFAYLVIQFPLCYQIGVQQRSVKLFYSSFLAAAVIFSVTFAMLGKVGGGVQSRIRSVALARHIEDGSFDVDGWANLANVFPGEFDVKFPGSGGLLSTTQEVEEVDGQMWPDPEFRARIHMAPDSRRTLYYRSRIPVQRSAPNVIGVSVTGARLTSLMVRLGPEYQETPLEARAIYGGSIYNLDIQNNTLSLKSTAIPTNLASYLDRPYDFGLNTWGTWQNGDDKEKDEEELTGMARYRNMTRMLIGNAYRLDNEVDRDRLRLPPGTLRLCILAPQPDELRVVTEDFPDQEGAVLYCFDLKVSQ